LNETQLELLENIRDLGIKVNSKLKFHARTNTVTKKAYCVLGLISKSFECKDPDVIVRLYTTLVCPSLNIIMFYGDLLTYLIIKN